MDLNVEIQPFSNEYLSIQDPEDGKSCSAHSTINTLILSGVSIPKNDREKLITQSQNIDQIDTAEKDKFFEQHGVDFHSLSMELLTVKRTPEELLQTIFDILQKHPIGFSISTLLSKRPEEFKKFKSIFHAVCAQLKDGIIEVIDPYDPTNPELFNIKSLTDRTRFFEWFNSPRAQQLLISQGVEPTSENVLEIARQKIQSKDREQQFLFLGENLSLTTSYYGVKKN